MPQKKRPSARKKTSSRARKKTRKILRGKVHLPLNRVITLCAAIVGICTVLLFVFTFAGNRENLPHQASSDSVVKNSAEKIARKNSEKKLPEVSKSNEADAGRTGKKIHEPEKNYKPAPEKPEKKEKNLSVPAENKKTAEKKTVIIEESKKQEEKRPVSDIPNFPAARNNAKLAFVFDDGGHNMRQLEKCISLPFPVTVAVLPRLAHSAQVAESVRKSGNEVILHQPMQSVNMKVNPGDGAITPDMDEEKIRSTVLANIYEIWPVSGMNNHEGSLITADAEKIAAVMQICSQQEIYFLDSRTNSDSKVRYVSSVMGYPYYERNVFLDNTKDRKEILSEIEKGVEFANKNGAAIMIGHVWSAEILPGILLEVYPLLKAKGYEFTTVSASGALKRG